MDPASEPGLIFHVIQEAGNQNEIVDCFEKHLQEVYAHCRDEIIQFYENLGMPVLLTIRDKLFSDLCKIFSLENYELIERRKMTCLADEVFIMGFSLVNKLMHKRLLKLLKPKKEEGDKSPILSDDERLSYAELVARYLSMQATFTDLKSLVKQLSTRISVLEEERNRSHVTGDSYHSHPKTKDTVSKDCDNPEKPNAVKVLAEVHHDILGNKQKPPMMVDSIDPEDKDTSEQLTQDAPFRHTRRDRKNILRKSRVMSHVQAAPKISKVQSETCLVYVGKLKTDTTEKAVRAHLHEIGIDHEDVADILRLNNKNRDYASFCISINTNESEAVALRRSNWPSGVAVRKFQRKTYTTQNRSRISPNYYSEARSRVHNTRSRQYRQPRGVNLIPGPRPLRPLLPSRDDDWCGPDRVYDYQHGSLHPEPYQLYSGMRYGLYPPSYHRK
jgi:hypothetical protein